MRVERADVRGVDEPSEGWVAGYPLIDTQLLTVTLCRFTGDKLAAGDLCLDRTANRHPDVDCHALFFQADALSSDMVAGAQLPEAVSEVRAPFACGGQLAVIERAP